LKSIKIKNLPELRSVVFGYFKVKKHSSGTPLTEWNSLTPRLIILVAGINVNDDFLSYLSNQESKNNEKKSFGLKLTLFLNLKI